MGDTFFPWLESPLVQWVRNPKYYEEMGCQDCGGVLERIDHCDMLREVGGSSDGSESLWESISFYRCEKCEVWFHLVRESFRSRKLIV